MTTRTALEIVESLDLLRLALKESAILICAAVILGAVLLIFFQNTFKD